MLRLATIILSGLILINNVPQAIAQGTAPNSSITSQSPAFKGIDLTTEQQQQIASLNQSTLNKINAQVNAEQQQQIKTALEGGKDLRTAVQSAGLSIRQKRSMKGIVESYPSEMKKILTASQYQQWEQNTRNRANGQ